MSDTWDSVAEGSAEGNGPRGNEPIVTGVGVLDRSMAVLNAVQAGPCGLGELQSRTGLARATAHRLAQALVEHGLLGRDAGGRYVLGLGLIGLGRAAGAQLDVVDLARPALERLRGETGESVQLYVPSGDRRVCVVALESAHGLRTIVPVGAVLPMERGSAGRVLLGAEGPHGWVETAEEREPGVASVSAPVRDRSGAVIAAVSVSGPIDRMGRRPGRRHGAAVTAAATEIGAALERHG